MQGECKGRLKFVVELGDPLSSILKHRCLSPSHIHYEQQSSMLITSIRYHIVTRLRSDLQSRHFIHPSLFVLSTPFIGTLKGVGKSSPTGCLSEAMWLVWPVSRF